LRPGPAVVAQDCILLYRGFATCGATDLKNASDRLSRLADCKSALQRLRRKPRWVYPCSSLGIAAIIPQGGSVVETCFNCIVPAKL
jgi:hypothetical protein